MTDIRKVDIWKVVYLTSSGKYIYVNFSVPEKSNLSFVKEMADEHKSIWGTPVGYKKIYAYDINDSYEQVEDNMNELPREDDEYNAWYDDPGLW